VSEEQVVQKAKPAGECAPERVRIAGSTIGRREISFDHL